MQARDKFTKLRLWPNKATQIEITPQQRHTEYELNFDSASIATDTGYLVLFRLEPSRPELPSFSARWDTKPNIIDVDLIGDAEESKKFKAGADGYSGHHTTCLSESPRIYQIDIRTPTDVIFVGTVQLLVEEALYQKEDVSKAIEGISDQLRILVVCHYCGPVRASGPPYVLDVCPKCQRQLPSQPTSQDNSC